MNTRHCSVALQIAFMKSAFIEHIQSYLFFFFKAKQTANNEEYGFCWKPSCRLLASLKLFLCCCCLCVNGFCRNIYTRSLCKAISLKLKVSVFCCCCCVLYCCRCVDLCVCVVLFWLLAKKVFASAAKGGSIRVRDMKFQAICVLFVWSPKIRITIATTTSRTQL